MRFRTLNFVLVLASASICLPALTNAASPFDENRMWEYKVTEDPFNGTIAKVYGIAVGEGAAHWGLISITNDEETPMLRLTDVDNYVCPDSDHAGDIEVSIWFSDGGAVLSQIWGVSEDGQSIHNYGWDGKEIYERMKASNKTIFRINDGCGDADDYWTSGRNLEQEWLRMADR